MNVLSGLVRRVDWKKVFLAICILAMLGGIMLAFHTRFVMYYPNTDFMSSWLRRCGYRLLRIGVGVVVVWLLGFVPHRLRIWFMALPFFVLYLWMLIGMFYYDPFCYRIGELPLYFSEVVAVSGAVAAMYGVSQYVNRQYHFEVLLMVLYLATYNVLSFMLVPSIYCVLLFDAFVLTAYLIMSRQKYRIVPLGIGVLMVFCTALFGVGKGYVKQAVRAFLDIYSLRDFTADYVMEEQWWGLAKPDRYPYYMVIYNEHGAVLFALIMVLYIALFATLFFYVKRYYNSMKKGAYAIVVVMVEVWMFDSIMQFTHMAQKYGMTTIFSGYSGWIWVIHVVVLVVTGFMPSAMKDEVVLPRPKKEEFVLDEEEEYEQFLKEQLGEENVMKERKICCVVPAPLDEWEPVRLAKEEGDFSKIDEYINLFTSGAMPYDDNLEERYKYPDECDVIGFLLRNGETCRAKRLLDASDPTVILRSNDHNPMLFQEMLQYIDDEAYLINAIRRLHEACEQDDQDDQDYQDYQDDYAFYDTGSLLNWALIPAHKAGKDKLVKVLLDFICQFSAEDYDDTFLFAMIRENNIVMVDAFLSVMKRGDKPCFSGQSEVWTPLECAVTCAYPDIVEVLIAHGANSNTLTSAGTGDTMLEVANDADVKRVLSRNGGAPSSEEVKLLCCAYTEINRGGAINGNLLDSLLRIEKNELRYKWRTGDGECGEEEVIDLLREVGVHKDLKSARQILKHFKKHNAWKSDSKQVLERLLNVNGWWKPAEGDAYSVEYIMGVLRTAADIGMRIYPEPMWGRAISETAYYYHASPAMQLLSSVLRCIKRIGNEYEKTRQDVLEAFFALTDNLSSENDKCAMLALSLEGDNLWMMKPLQRRGIRYYLLDQGNKGAVSYLLTCSMKSVPDIDAIETRLKYLLADGVDINYHVANGDTAWDRTKDYPEPYASELRELLREYGAEATITEA